MYGNKNMYCTVAQMYRPSPRINHLGSQQKYAVYIPRKLVATAAISKSHITKTNLQPNSLHFNKHGFTFVWDCIRPALVALSFFRNSLTLDSLRSALVISNHESVLIYTQYKCLVVIHKCKQGIRYTWAKTRLDQV